MSYDSSAPSPSLRQFLEKGFSLEIGHWPDTPLEKGDQLLFIDPFGQVLIARAPLSMEN